ncbi:DUF6428 family protein [Flavobacterium sp.]|uniref:DUF6428 family protein n=1 Tax=Flavobacterium sp. TaxID=239 RepID=UPI002602FC0C|nr:DUF6428 family protein [Flavobacterium sp.]
MKLSTFMSHLEGRSEIQFQLPNGQKVPAHFHITEAGHTTKRFIDCGGTFRTTKNLTLQVWVANDTEHRLTPEKLIHILKMAEPLYQEDDLEIEVEYQDTTICRYGLSFEKGVFRFEPKFTDCLAKDHCGIPEAQMPQKNTTTTATCTPGGGCC